MSQDGQPDPTPEEISLEILVDEGEGNKPDAKGTSASTKNVVLPDGTVLGLSAEEQARIDLLYDDLEDKNFYELLKVKREAPIKAIKRAYYQLSKEYHPDKFFRRDLGPYKPRLELIFARINEAYRVLSDDRMRDDYDVSKFGDDEDADGKLSMATHEVNFVGEALKDRATRRGLQVQKKKKGEVPHFLKKAQTELTKRLRRARKAFIKGQKHYDLQEYEDAASMFQLAAMLDERNTEAKKLYKLARSASRDTQAEGLWRKGREAMMRENNQEAARMFKAAVDCNPSKGKYYLAFGKMIWEHTMRQRTAIELFRTAVEKEPNKIEFLLELAKAYESVGMPSNALKAFERAAQVAPDNSDVKKALKRLR